MLGLKIFHLQVKTETMGTKPGKILGILHSPKCASLKSSVVLNPTLHITRLNYTGETKSRAFTFLPIKWGIWQLEYLIRSYALCGFWDIINITTVAPSGRPVLLHNPVLISSHSLVYLPFCHWSSSQLRSYSQSVFRKLPKELNQLDNDTTDDMFWSESPGRSNEAGRCYGNRGMVIW